jgi:hypothetical protein
MIQRSLRFESFGVSVARPAQGYRSSLRSVVLSAKVAEDRSMSKFKTGQPKPPGSGRSAGVPNRRSQVLSHLLEDAGLLIPEKIIELLPQVAPEKQLEALLELMAFVFPKRKAVEHKVEAVSEDNEPMVISYIEPGGRVSAKHISGSAKSVARWQQENAEEHADWVEKDKD